MNVNQPSSEEIHQAADVIKRLPKGYLPFELFIAVASKVTVPTMEVAPLRRTSDGNVEVLLTKRPVDDPYWPGGWHLTGTVIRANDKEGTDFSSGVERVLRDELHGAVKPIDGIKYAGMKFWDVKRGRELDQMFYFETKATDTDVREGKFFNVNSLPESTLEHHKIMIPEIVAAFLSNS